MATARLTVHQVRTEQDYKRRGKSTSVDNISFKRPFVVHTRKVNRRKRLSNVSVFTICYTMLLLTVICSFGIMKQLCPIESMNIEIILFGLTIGYLLQQRAMIVY